MVSGIILCNQKRKVYFVTAPKAADELAKIRADVSSPEEIHDRVETAPSKRIQRICGGYEKPLHGVLIAEDIGLELIHRECTIFNAWLQRLESLPPSCNG
jgi:hypothetical protein